MIDFIIKIDIMFLAELKEEFICRIEEVVIRYDLTDAEKKSIIGKLFMEFEKKNKSQISKTILPPVKDKRKLTIYNKFMKEKMKELENTIVPSKLRFKEASAMWNK